MSSNDWRSEWDAAAQAEADRYAVTPTADLLASIQRGDVGEYHTIWPAIAQRATASEAAWPLFAILESQAPYLSRYHCAAALLAVLKLTDIEPAALSATWPTLPASLAAMRARIEALMGPRPGG